MEVAPFSADRALLRAKDSDLGWGKTPEPGKASRSVSLSPGCPWHQPAAWSITGSWSQPLRLWFHWPIVLPEYWDFCSSECFMGQQHLCHLGVCYKSEAQASLQTYWIGVCISTSAPMSKQAMENLQWETWLRQGSTFRPACRCRWKGDL